MQKASKKIESAKKAHMAGVELKRIRLSLKFAPRDMRATLVPKGAKPMPRRTYEDYEANRRGIPAAVAARARELDRHNQEFMAGIPNRVDAAERGEG